MTLSKIIALAVVLAAVAVTAFWFLTVPKVEPVAEFATPHTADLVNGKTMFDIGGCVSCHARGKDDRTHLGGGEPLKSPFGTFYPPNISSDPKDGIGAWTGAQFVTAMRDGTSPAGEHLYPAFPYTSYRRMTTGDLLDLFAYLKTLPPVQGRARNHDLPFPFDIRRLVGGWKLLFLDAEPFTPDSTKSAEWNRGAYLVNGPGHCAECHTARNALGGLLNGQRFAGGPDPEGKGWVPNITQKGIGSWTERDIADFLQSGMTPEFDSVGGGMAAVIRNTAQLNAADRQAMAVYIKSLPPIVGPVRPSKN
ncbi:MAG: cytochrome c [Proteobacteria bacterium]|nr:cytochrome c [Pseudomonadota bacterium]